MNDRYWPEVDADLDCATISATDPLRSFDTHINSADFVDLEAPYSRSECENSDGGFPDRGLFCPKCKTRIPQFADLSEHDEFRIRKLIRDGRGAMAMKELEAATSCHRRWSKIWVTHAGRPTPEYPGKPCPYCDKPLRTSLAKQCPHCLMDWHDPGNPRHLTDS